MKGGDGMTGMDAMAHIEAAHREGKTLSAYAGEHGLSRQHLYHVRRRMRELCAGPEDSRTCTAKATEPPEPGSPFVEVKMTSLPVGTSSPRARLWAHLPNGVNVELLCTSADADLLMTMMDSLGRVPCSASMKV
jgi:transposase